MGEMNTLRVENAQLRLANEHLREIIHQRNATIQSLASRLSASKNSIAAGMDCLTDPAHVPLMDIETHLRHEMFRLHGIDPGAFRIVWEALEPTKEDNAHDLLNEQGVYKDCERISK